MVKNDHYLFAFLTGDWAGPELSLDVVAKENVLALPGN
jgi:hypothetical protein